MANTTNQLVHCRYPKCLKLHATTELRKEDAVQGGSKNTYYHPDCWDTMQTVNRIKDLFCKHINTTMTGKQIGQLVSITNNLIFDKKVDPKLIEFSIEYFIKYKPGKLRFPGGLHYIVQDKDVTTAWAKEQDKKIKEELKRGLRAQTSIIDDPIDFELPDVFPIDYSNNKKSKFSSVLGV